MSRVTLRDVAERAGVSTAAISQALNDRGNLRPGNA
ncbi:MAG: LacI family DNA-binding transcriptional regulator [Microbacterium sp.]